MPARKSRLKHPKQIPAFASEDDEREFWATAEVTDYFDVSTAKVATFPNLKPSTATISLRLPQGMLDELRVLANQRDVPYQSLLKVFLADRLVAERRRLRPERAAR
jgi:predicted DNA binding CopG/RHH family protein